VRAWTISFFPVHTIDHEEDRALRMCSYAYHAVFWRVMVYASEVLGRDLRALPPYAAYQLAQED
jgi:hypothetical protein